MRCINADIKVPSLEAQRVCCPFSPGLDLSDSNHRAQILHLFWVFVFMESMFSTK